MSAELLTITETLPPASAETLKKLDAVHALMRAAGEIPIATEHVLHGGMYARTIRMEAGTVLLGSLIALPTMVILHGSASILTGDEWTRMDGYHVLPASAGRKQLFRAWEKTELTMIFPTAARTVEEAENEVFAEAEMLTSRREDAANTITVTGE